MYNCRSNPVAACPASGFYCPGRLDDSVNEVRGSKPIVLETGGVVSTVLATVQETREQVRTTLEVDDSVNRTQLLHVLSSLYQAANYG